MSQTQDQATTLPELEAALATNRDVYADDLHLRLQELAEAGGPEVTALLVRALASPEVSWRVEAVGNLGFQRESGPEALAAIRRLLREDPDAAVRQAAAAVLPLHSTWPDPWLAGALRHDRDGLVGLLAFEGLLKLAGVPQAAVQQAMRRARSGKLAVSVDGLREIVGERVKELESEKKE